MIRPRDTGIITVQGEELDEIHDLVRAQSCAGWEMISAPVTMAPDGYRLLHAGRLVVES